jgi:hypothetical protein
LDSKFGQKRNFSVEFNEDIKGIYDFNSDRNIKDLKVFEVGSLYGLVKTSVSSI